MSTSSCFRLGWHEISYIPDITNHSLREKLLERLAHEGWAGTRISAASRLEQAAIDGWFEPLRQQEKAIRLKAHNQTYMHPICGVTRVEVFDYYVLHEYDRLELDNVLDRLPIRWHDIPVGREAAPATREALVGLNWMIFRGRQGRCLSVQNTDRLLSLRTLAALTKA